MHSMTKEDRTSVELNLNNHVLYIIVFCFYGFPLELVDLEIVISKGWLWFKSL